LITRQSLAILGHPVHNSVSSTPGYVNLCADVQASHVENKTINCATNNV